MKSGRHYDDAVVGAGILGLAHAFQLARRGRRVVVFERNSRASGASIRNFGMLWPIGQPFGPLRKLARRSLEIWLEVLASACLWHERSGSLHLAYCEDEAQVLREFADESRRHGQPVHLLSPEGVSQRASAVKLEKLQLGLWSDVETCVDPRAVVAALPAWLSREFGVEFQFNRTISAVAIPQVFAGDERWSVDRLWICSGDELGLLFSDELRDCGLLRCKLQMMRSEPLSRERRIGPMLAAGLTVRHYASFQNCPGLLTVRRRVARESPWFDRFGIHVMVSQNGTGELTIGDSHEYDDAIEPFDKAEIDALILDYLGTFLEGPPPRIASRWHGSYVKHPDKPYVVLEPSPNVTAVTGLGGAGMTLSFGLAEQIVNRALGVCGFEPGARRGTGQ